MRIAAPLSTLVVSLGAMVAVGTPAAAAAASPTCADPVAGLIHTVHDAAGPAGEPVHVAEAVYCAVTPL